MSCTSVKKIFLNNKTINFAGILSDREELEIVMEKRKICFRPGSNRGPCACEAHVITATLRKRRCSGHHHFPAYSCDPVHVSYQFHNLPPHQTPGHPHSRDITWDDSHVILLGTIDQNLLVEYLRGPPLVMEVHDCDRRLDKVQQESLFGAEQRDELLGTHAFGAGMYVTFMYTSVEKYSR